MSCARPPFPPGGDSRWSPTPCQRSSGSASGHSTKDVGALVRAGTTKARGNWADLGRPILWTGRRIGVLEVDFRLEGVQLLGSRRSTEIAEVGGEVVSGRVGADALLEDALDPFGLGRRGTGLRLRSLLGD